MAIIDISAWLRRSEAVKKQARFAVALALTRTAQDAQRSVTQALPQTFDRPNPWTQKAIAVTPARKDNLESVVFAKDSQAKYLGIQEVGGTRTPKPGTPVVVPVNIRLNAFGNIGRGVIKREVHKPGTFTVGQGEKLPPGIYRRTKGRGQGRGKVRLLIAVEKRAKYSPRFNFRRRVTVVAKRTFPRNFENALKQALATAR